MGLSQDIPSRLCRLLFTVTLLVAWSEGPALMAQAPASADRANANGGNAGSAAATPDREPTPDDVKAFAARVEDVLAAVEKADRELPRDRFDPAAVVAQAGKDPQALLAWVKGNTAWVPYRGALRGAAGTLMDRVGNSTDRALLLAELLRSAGHTARLANAPLTEAQARALRETLTTTASVAEPPPDGTAAWDQAMDKEAARQGVDPRQLRRDVEQLAAPVNRIAEELAQRVAEQVPALTAAVRDGVPPAPPEDPSGRELASLKDHWWVQLSQGGSWVDLDPMPPDGKSSPAPTKTVPLDRNPGKIPLPASDCHEVKIRVVAEQWKGGQLVEAPALTYSFRPAEVLGKRITLSHVPLDWPADLDLSSAAAPAARLQDAVLAQKEWVPSLRVGDTTVMQGGVTTSGSIDPKPTFDAMAKTGGAAGGAAKKAASILDDLPGGDDAGAAKKKPTAPDDAGVWTAQWVEYEIRTPGAAPQTIRRPLFDLVGPAARDAVAAAKGALPQPPSVSDAQKFERALAVFSSAEILALPCRPAAPFVQHMVDAELLAMRPALRDVLKPAVAGDLAAAGTRAAQLAPMPAAPYLFALARSQWSRVRNQTFVDRPDLVAFHRRLAVGGPTGLLKRVLFDVVANPVQVRPAQAGAAAPDPFAARLEQGVVDSNLETLLAGDDAAALSASDLYRRSPSQGVRWVTLRPGEAGKPPDWGDVQLPEKERALIERDLSAGLVAVVPTKPLNVEGRPAAVGWWRVDPRTGETLAMTESGGSSTTEYTLQQKILITANVAGWTFIGCGGAAPGASTGKRLGCAVCAAVMAALMVFSFGFGAGAPGLLGRVAGGLSGPQGAVRGGGAGMACNALSGLVN